MPDIRAPICVLSSVTDQPDQRVIGLFESYRQFLLDPDYKRILPLIHGGVPVRQYFATANGDVRRIGRFLTFLDKHSTLSDPPRPTRDDCREFDERVWDPGVPYITDCDPDFFLGALFTRHWHHRGIIDPNDCESSLHNFDLPVLDTVCFDRTTKPNSIVVCDTHKAALVADEHDPNDIVDYSEFTEFVADSFTGFLDVLSESPSGQSNTER